MFSKTTTIVSINTTTFYITNKFISNSIIIFTCIVSYLSNNSRRRAVYLNPSTGQPSINTGSIDNIGFNVINFNSSSFSNIIINSFFWLFSNRNSINISSNRRSISFSKSINNKLHFISFFTSRITFIVYI